MPKIVLYLIGVIYWPLAIIWVVLYGVIGGSIFKFIACWEECFLWIRQDLRKWKRYQGRKAYLDLLETNEILAAEHHKYYDKKSREVLDKIHPNTPFPWWQIFSFIINFFVISLLRPFAGMIEGPGVVFRDCKRFWAAKILGKSDMKDLKEILELERKIAKGECSYQDHKWEYVRVL
jgi:hypothetical protein